MTDTRLWKIKLVARLHDPAEKALVLLRDPAGHENGTSRSLSRLLGLGGEEKDPMDHDDADALASVLFLPTAPEERRVTRADYRIVQRADWWASAADRPQWPMEEIVVERDGQQRTLAVASWARVNFASRPVLIHPLTGTELPLPGGLTETDYREVKRRSFEHFASLLQRVGSDATATPDGWRRILATLWRFGPELRETDDHHRLGALWQHLPADTRTPDHSIWEHLDLVSAFAGAFSADPDGQAALLSLSIGPVQGFIAQARKIDDLWAGSHLLSRLAWETMRPICEELGPDAVVFPRLRGIPQVDLWLRDALGVPPDLFDDCDWQQHRTDANPLFAAALPNRFVAIVPASRGEELARRAAAAAREWMQALGCQVVDTLLRTAGLDTAPDAHCFRQMREQLEDFPEVHWALVPFSLIGTANPERQTGLDTVRLSEAMAPFFHSDQEGRSGFLASDAWKVLQPGAELTLEDGRRRTFFAPNPGVLYPAVHELAERVHAAAKTARSFRQLPQQGWRCTLSGESEWLATDPAHLHLKPHQRKDTLWTRVAYQKKSWVKEGEHLGGLAAVKRLWPSIYSDEISGALKSGVERFAISTHTMALAHQLQEWLKAGAPLDAASAEQIRNREPTALPRRMMRSADPATLRLAKRIPSLLDAASEEDTDAALEEARKVVRKILARAGDDGRLETYYGMLMMDGDQMGATLAGRAETSITYLQSFHPAVRAGFEKLARGHPALERYGREKRAMSPNRHLAISTALNDFSQIVVRHVVEEEHLGRLIYAGGDDVLAMLPVAELTHAMTRLRHAYSGTGDSADSAGALRCANGYATLRQGGNQRLLRLMGESSTASAGAVIAHHQAPLGSVMRELRAAEQRAKQEGGRDAFSISVVKRSGGTLRLTARWQDMQLLEDAVQFLQADGTSRRAIYNSLEWIRDLPSPDNAETKAMLAALLGFQLRRQSAKDQHGGIPGLAARLAEFAASAPPGRQGDRTHGSPLLERLASLLGVAEFLARETRRIANP